MGEIFGKVTSAKLKSNFSGPAGGSALERASPPTKDCSTWLVETEIHSELEEQYFIAHAPGQIVAELLGEIRENIFTKMKISRDPVQGFRSEAVRIEIGTCSLRSCKREVWENFSRRDRPSSRWLVETEISSVLEEQFL